MRSLFPFRADEVDVSTVYDVARPVPDGRPWVLANMVTSLDGTATVEGASGGLSSPADKALFLYLRSLADVVVVAAGTVRAEHYGPVRGPDPVPIAVVTKSLDLDLDTPFFTEAVARPIVLTGAASDEARRAEVAAVADVVLAGEDRVDLPVAFAELARRGYRVALCEGGPTLLAGVVAAELLDELCLTLAPLLVAGAGLRILRGGVLDEPARLPLASVLEDDGSLFLRYARA